MFTGHLLCKKKNPNLNRSRFRWQANHGLARSYPLYSSQPDTCTKFFYKTSIRNRQPLNKIFFTAFINIITSLCLEIVIFTFTFKYINILYKSYTQYVVKMDKKEFHRNCWSWFLAQTDNVSQQKIPIDYIQM